MKNEILNKKIKKKVIFCTFSDFKSGNQGDSVNDRKLFNAIPQEFEKVVI